MIWDDVLDRLTEAGLSPVEETYMEHYGAILASQAERFKGRTLRCTYGKIRCEKVSVEILLFPSESHLQDFMELVGDDPWWLASNNAVLHFPVCDPKIVEQIFAALR